jgi:acetoin utilization deacetylase AcuC-like enzyme
MLNLTKRCDISPPLQQVHQGDGTAAICDGDPRIFTASFHCESNFPAKKERSTLDVPLADNTGDEEYLGTLGRILPDILSSFQPDLVLYDAGVDVHKDDTLGRLALTDEGIYRREMLVLDTCVAAGSPLAAFVGGGYAEDLSVLARRHTLLHRAAQEIWDGYGL